MSWRSIRVKVEESRKETRSPRARTRVRRVVSAVGKVHALHGCLRARESGARETSPRSQVGARASALASCAFLHDVERAFGIRIASIPACRARRRGNRDIRDEKPKEGQDVRT